MMILFRRGAGVMIVSLLAIGCTGASKALRPSARSAPPSPSTRAQATNASPSETWRAEMVGEITSVRAAGQFAVVRFPVGVMPPPGTVLAVWRQGVKSAEVRVTGPQRDLLTVVDILKGECRIGDEVRSY